MEGLTREAVAAILAAPDPSTRTGKRDLAELVGVGIQRNLRASFVGIRRIYFYPLVNRRLCQFMRYLDITTDDKRKALATLEGEKEKNVTKKWKDSSGSPALWENPKV